MTFPWNKGIKTGPRPQEVIDRIVQSRKGYKHSPETIEKLKLSHKGKKSNNALEIWHKEHATWNKGNHRKLNNALSEWHKKGGIPWNAGTSLIKQYKTEYFYKKDKMPEKLLAYTAVRKAVRNRILIKSIFCQECGILSKLEAHHKNYNKQLEVIWLYVKNVI